MRKFIKIILVIFLVSIIAIAIGTFAIVKFVNPNDFKDRIIKEVAAKTGRELSIRGNLSWEFFPWLGLKVEAVSLSNNKNFGANGNLADIGSAHASISLWALLHHEVKLKLALRDFNLQLIKRVDGETNWRDLVTGDERKIDASKIEKAGSDKSGKGPSVRGMSLGLSSIAIENATIIWEDRTTGKNIAVRGFTLKIKDVDLSRPVPFYLSFAFYNNAPLFSGDITAQGTGRLDFAKRLYSFEPLDISGQIKTEEMIRPLPFALKANINADLTKQSVTSKDIFIKLADLTLNASLEGKEVLDAPTFSGNVEIMPFALRSILVNYFSSNITKLPSGALTDLALKLRFQATSKFLKVPELMVKVDDNVLQGSLNYTNFASRYLGFNLSFNNFTFNRYAALLAIPTSKAKTVVKTKISKGKKVKYVTTIEVKGVVPRSVEAEPSFFKTLQLDGAIKIASLQLEKVRASNVALTVTGSNGVVNLDPISAKLYNGSLRGKASLDLSSAVPGLNVNCQLSSIDISQFLQDLADLKKFSGRADLGLRFTAKGSDLDAILSSMNGSGNFVLNNGVWSGVDMAYQVNLANAIINNKPKPVSTEPPRTDFGRLTGSFKITDGILQNPDFLLQSDRFSVSGQGSVNLPRQTLDYSLEASESRGEQSFSVPIKVSGSFSDIKVTPNVENLIMKAAKHGIEKVIQKNLPDLKIKLDAGSTGKLLKSLGL